LDSSAIWSLGFGYFDPSTSVGGLSQLFAVGHGGSVNGLCVFQVGSSSSAVVDSA
jgi:hypothetical protein